MALKLVYVFAEGDFDKGMRRMAEPIASAASAAVKEAGQLALTGGRASIASAGFGAKWQNTYRLRLYPGGTKPSINAAAFLFHKIPYAGVFEEGATIQGKPRLWIPLRNAPKKIGRLAMTPANYRQNVGPLFPIVRPGKPMLLAARVRLTSVGQRRVVGSISIATLRRGGSSGRLVSVPLFVAARSVTLRPRFHIGAAAEVARGALPSLYVKNLRAD